jgi:hypothetical protein
MDRSLSSLTAVKGLISSPGSRITTSRYKQMVGQWSFTPPRFCVCGFVFLYFCKIVFDERILFQTRFGFEAPVGHRTPCLEESREQFEGSPLVSHRVVRNDFKHSGIEVLARLANDIILVFSLVQAIPKLSSSRRRE